jgi:integrase
VRRTLQTAARDRWIAARRQELLPTRYLHVVFTLPYRLAPLVLQNKKVLYGLPFPAESKSGHLDRDTAKTYHSRALSAIENAAKKEEKQPPVKPFPPYTMRHTALTRLAEAGCDAFTLARIAGHFSITITQPYCHPQADAIERAFSKLTSSSNAVRNTMGAAAEAASK